MFVVHLGCGQGHLDCAVERTLTLPRCVWVFDSEDKNITKNTKKRKSRKPTG